MSKCMKTLGRRIPSPTARGRSGLALFRRGAALRGAGLSLAGLALLIQFGLSAMHRPAMAMTPEARGFARLAAFFGEKLALCFKDSSTIPARATPREAPSYPAWAAEQSLDGALPLADAFVLAGCRPVPPRALIGEALTRTAALVPTGQPRAPPIV